MENKTNRNKIRFRDLSWVLKVAAIGAITDAIVYGIYFIDGFIQGWNAGLA